MTASLRRGLAIVSAGAAVAAGAGATEPVWAAHLSCQPRASRGRVVCELEVETRQGRLAWADAVVVSAPKFARPLKSRVGPPDAHARTDRRIRLPIGFLAEGPGKGTVVVRARAVICGRVEAGGEECSSVSREASADLAVGPVEPGAGS